MKGQEHIQISVLTGFILTIPFILTDSVSSVLFLAGIFLGSLLPDSDASDRTAKHGNSVLFAFDTINEILIYPLLLMIFHEKKRHRGILHTFIGVLVFTIILTAISGIVFIIFRIQFNFLIIGLGMFVGGVLHLMEDSCTRSGVVPFYPKSPSAFKGEVSTFGRKDSRPGKFSKYLAFVFVILIIVQVYYKVAQLSMVLLVMAVIALSWAGFFWCVR